MDDVTYKKVDKLTLVLKWSCSVWIESCSGALMDHFSLSKKKKKRQEQRCLTPAFVRSLRTQKNIQMYNDYNNYRGIQLTSQTLLSSQTRTGQLSHRFIYISHCFHAAFRQSQNLYCFSSAVMGLIYEHEQIYAGSVCQNIPSNLCLYLKMCIHRNTSQTVCMHRV